MYLGACQPCFPLPAGAAATGSIPAIIYTLSNSWYTNGRDQTCYAMMTSLHDHTIAAHARPSLKGANAAGNTHLSLPLAIEGRSTSNTRNFDKD